MRHRNHWQEEGAGINVFSYALDDEEEDIKEGRLLLVRSPATGKPVWRVRCPDDSYAKPSIFADRTDITRLHVWRRISIEGGKSVLEWLKEGGYSDAAQIDSIQVPPNPKYLKTCSRAIVCYVKGESWQCISPPHSFRV
jgi:hypothetical protein